MSPTLMYHISPRKELSVRIGKEGNLTITLTAGSAEVFGSGLTLHRAYTYPGGYNFPVFSYSGGTVSLTGDHFTCKVQENIMTQFNLAVHHTIEKMAHRAEGMVTPQPTVMVVGPQDQGKTSLCKLLVNYSVRAGNRPLFVDLDVGQNSISLPGTISAVPVVRPLDPVREFDDLTPRVLHFGHKSPADNKALYKHLLGLMAYQCHVLTNFNPSINKHSPWFINTCGWVRDFGYEIIMEAAVLFEVRLVLVLGDRELGAKLRSHLPECAQILNLVKDPGVVARERNFRHHSRILKVQQYFKGVDGTLETSRVKLHFKDIEVYRAGKITLKSDDDDDDDRRFGELPDYEGGRVGPVDIHRIPFDKLRNRTVLSIMENAFPHNGLTTCLRGYVIVHNINMSDQYMEVYSPKACTGDKMFKFLAMSYLSDTV